MKQNLSVDSIGGRLHTASHPGMLFASRGINWEVKLHGALIEGLGVVSADFNQDGIADLAMITPNAEVLVLLGAETGLFRRSFSFEVDGPARGLRAADLDGDGVVDLAVTHGGRGGISLFHGKGDGTFAAAGRLSAKQPTTWSLTPREIQVARLAARGFTCAEIAVKLGIGRRTAETHVVAIRSKLELRHKRELVQRATPTP